jgi:hypothetical protein
LANRRAVAPAGSSQLDPMARCTIRKSGNRFDDAIKSRRSGGRFSPAARRELRTFGRGDQRYGSRFAARVGIATGNGRAAPVEILTTTAVA